MIFKKLNLTKNQKKILRKLELSCASLRRFEDSPEGRAQQWEKINALVSKFDDDIKI